MIRLSYLFLLLLALCSCHASADTVVDRGSQPLKNENFLRRSLAESYLALPFRITWKIEIEEAEGEDRQPNMREYIGVAQATSKWLKANAQTIYGDILDIQGVQCMQNAATWNPDIYLHGITLDCQVSFVADSNDIEAAPTIGSLLLDLSAQSSVGDFLKNYLKRSGGSSSLFRHSNRATYATYERGSYEALEADPVASGATSNDTIISEETQSMFDNFYAFTFDVHWNFVLRQDESGSQSEDDYASVVQSTQSWLKDSIEEFYTSKEPETFLLHQVSAQLIGQPRWNTSPRSLTTGVMVVWEANTETYVPTPAEFLKDMSVGFDLGGFLQKLPGDFLNIVGEVSYGLSYTNPTTGLASEAIGSMGVSIEDTISVPIDMTMTFGLRDSTDGLGMVGFDLASAPTEQEWNGLLQATEDFLGTFLKEHYSNSNTNTTLEEMTAEWNWTEYRPWETLMPYRVSLALNMVFSEGSPVSLSSFDYKFLISGLFGNNKDEYLSRYVYHIEPESNPFRSIERVAWGF